MKMRIIYHQKLWILCKLSGYGREQEEMGTFYLSIHSLNSVTRSRLTSMSSFSVQPLSMIFNLAGRIDQNILDSREIHDEIPVDPEELSGIDQLFDFIQGIIYRICFSGVGLDKSISLHNKKTMNGQCLYRPVMFADFDKESFLSFRLQLADDRFESGIIACCLWRTLNLSKAAFRSSGAIGFRR